MRTVHVAGIEAIVDLAIDEPPIAVTRDIVYCRLPIADRIGNSAGHIQLVVETICQILESQVPQLVACSAGMSCSPALVFVKQNAISFPRHSRLSEGPGCVTSRWVFSAKSQQPRCPTGAARRDHRNEIWARLLDV